MKPKPMTPSLTPPLKVWVEDETVTIINAHGWHVCTMEEMGEEGERKAELLAAAFNKHSP